MRMKIGLCLATAIALLAGCNRGAATNNVVVANKAATSNAAAPANSAAPANAAAPAGNSAAAAGTPATSAQLIGRWGLTAECAMTLEFQEDGTLVQAAGGQSDTSAWELGADGALTITKEGRPPEVGSAAIAGASLVLTDPAGAPTTFTRCQ